MKLASLFSIMLLTLSAAVGADGFNFAADGSVLWDGKKLIVAENVVVQDKAGLLTDAAPEQSAHKVGSSAVRNLYSQKADFPCRREISINAEQIELTFQAHVDSFKVGEKGPAQRYEYSAVLDVSNFDGGSYYVITGRPFRPVINQGDFSADKGVNISGVRFLALKKGDRKLALDFNPEGVTNYSTSRWIVKTRNRQLHIIAGMNNTYRGGNFGGKVVIYEGDEKDNSTRHAQSKYGYSENFPVARSFSFGAEVTGKQYTHADTEVFNGKYGWDGKIAAQKVVFAPSGALYSALQGQGKAVFKVSGLKPGIYYVTYCGSAMQKDSGRFSVKVEDQEFFSDQQIKAGELLTAAKPFWIEDGTAEVAFYGDWQISTLQFQLLQTSSEDFKFRRGYWVSNDFEPSVMARNSYFARPPAMKCDIYSVKLAPHRPVYPANHKLNMPRRVLLPESTAQNAWRYNELYISSGNNSARFDEFVNDEQKERELDIISRNGGRIVLVSGLLSRHTYPDHMARADRYIADFTRLAHKRDMKVLDHVDLTLLWNAEAGFRVMCETTDFLQRDVRNWSVNRLYCLNNPHSNKKFFDWAKNLVKTSNIDGMMVDEVVFFTESFCGCRYCRAAFTRDTGLILSMDETDSMLGNSSDPTWKAWLQWRYKSVGDWWVSFREVISEVKPDFSTLVYTTHGGFSNRHAGAYFETARAVDILGTEIMSRNVIAAARPVNAYRKMKSGLGDFYHAPIYGLVYPGGNCYNIAYFGWALNYMNRQTTWDKSLPLPPGGVDYKNYANRLDHRLSKPISDTLMVYSLPTVLFPANIRYVNEILGISELLSDQGIMHDFVINAALTDGKTLQRAKTLILANARSMSDEEIAAVKAFAKNGGTVYLSFNCATANELGVARKEWPFAEVFGVSVSTGKVLKTDVIQTVDGQEHPISGLSFLALPGTIKPDVQVIYRAGRGKKFLPCVLSAAYGKGRIIFSSAAWGALFVEFESGPGKKYSWDPAAGELALVKKVLQDLQPSKALVKMSVLPEKVLVSLSGNDHVDGELICVNMLNCGNGAVVGKVTPANMSADRGKVASDIVFEVDIPSGKVAEVYAVSPDFAGKKALKYQVNANSKLQVTVPKEMLKTFLEARIRLKK